MSLFTASLASEVAMVIVVETDTDFSLADVLVTISDPPVLTPTLPSRVLASKAKEVSYETTAVVLKAYKRSRQEWAPIPTHASISASTDTPTAASNSVPTNASYSELVTSAAASTDSYPSLSTRSFQKEKRKHAHRS
jgi:hypothetical protein